MSKAPKTFAQEFCLEEASFFTRLRRDIRLLAFLGTTFIKWVKARKVRAEFERCRQEGEPFYVDQFAPPGSGADQ